MAGRRFGSLSSSVVLAVALGLGCGAPTLAADPPHARGGAGPGCGCPTPTTNVARSRQSGAIVCVAAQDANGCDLQSIAVPQPGVERPGSSDDRETLERLQNMSRPGGRLIGEEDPEAQLQTAMQTPPNAWTLTEFGAVKASLLAMAEKRLPREGLAELNEALELNGSALLRIFTDIAYQRRVERLPLGRFEATVSYGCLQVAEPGMTAVIRVPFSAAIRRCDEF